MPEKKKYSEDEFTGYLHYGDLTAGWSYPT